MKSEWINDFRLKILGKGRDSNDVVEEIAQVTYRGRRSLPFILSQDLAEGAKAIVAAAQSVGISMYQPGRQSAVLGRADRCRTRRRKGHRRFRIVRRYGWNGADFILPSSQLTIPDVVAGQELRDPKRLGAGENGTLSDWRQLMSDAGAGNPLVRFGILSALATPLLGMADVNSHLIALVGPSSTGKTSLLALIASVWGGYPLPEIGVARTWSATVNGMEDLMVVRADMAIVLDDVGAIPMSGGARGAYDTFRSVNWNVASGTTKLRLSDDSPPASFRHVLWTSMNTDAASWAKSVGRTLEPQDEVRLQQLRVGDGTPVWNFSSSDDRDAILADFRSRALENYGTAGATFASYLARKRCEDEKELKRRVGAYVRYALKRLSVNPLDGRQVRCAKYFAIAYAAARLGRRAGIVPWSRAEAWHAIEHAFACRVRLSEEPEVADYAEKLIAAWPKVEKGLVRLLPDASARAVKRRATGFETTSNGRPEICMDRPQFRRLLDLPKGSMKAVFRTLAQANLLVQDESRAYSLKRLIGNSRGRYIVFNRHEWEKRWAEAHGE